ncbi:MAG: hypothetical protein JO152_02310 [Mycobacteriaceae bacterium]|nr:hypothetical protein [Mycobacteriaceae bacterium]
MEMPARAIAIAATASLFLAGCGATATGTVAEPHRAAAPLTTMAVAAMAPAAAPGADADGNPACPSADAWGKAPSDDGIFVTYWTNDPDYVTALVRTTNGTDFAKSAPVRRDQLFQIFDFPGVDPKAVGEVLITTNVRRCYATPDPATSGR